MHTETLEVLTSTRLADRAHQMLLDAIMAGDLVAGQQLHDREWSAHLEISRTPVREAFQRLHWQGLTEVSAARYTKLVSFTTDSARVQAAGWAAIHATLAGSLCRRNNDVLISQLGRARARHLDAAPGPGQATANSEFFRLLRDASPLHGLRDCGAAMTYRLRLADTKLPRSGDADAALQTALIAALADGDAAAFQGAFDLWADYLPQDGRESAEAAA